MLETGYDNSTFTVSKLFLDDWLGHIRSMDKGKELPNTPKGAHQETAPLLPIGRVWYCCFQVNAS